MSDRLLKLYKKILDPCKNCLVKPLCSTRTKSRYPILTQRYDECEKYKNHMRNYTKFESMTETLHTGIILAILFLFFLYIIATFIMGFWHQYILLFKGA
jgi:hypothetical protein